MGPDKGLSLYLKPSNACTANRIDVFPQNMNRKGLVRNEARIADGLLLVLEIVRRHFFQDLRPLFLGNVGDVLYRGLFPFLVLL